VHHVGERLAEEASRTVARRRAANREMPVLSAVVGVDEIVVVGDEVMTLVTMS
jgi:hypothetical protein